MRRIAVFVGSILIASLVLAEDTVDKTGRADEILADYLLNQEALDQQPHAFVASGECVVAGKNEGFTSRNVRYLAIHDSASNQLIANSRFHESSLGGLGFLLPMQDR